MKRLFLCVLLIVPVTAVTQGQESMDVCSLVKSAKQYDGKTVVVSGFARADRHLTGIQGDGCPCVIISYDAESVPHEFANGIEDKRLKLDLRPFKVTVEGKFKRRVKAPLGYVSRIEVDKVLYWEFIGEKASVKKTP